MAIGPALILGLLGCAPSALRAVTPPPPAPAAVEAVATVPARARYHYLVGELALAGGDLDAAEAAFDTALLHDRESPWVWLALADVARADGRDPRLEVDRAAQAVRLGPDLAAPWVALGNAQARAGNRDAAVTAWRTATTRGAGSEAWAPLAADLLAHADPAATAAVRAWADVPEADVGYRRERGRARLQVGDLAGAVDDLAPALVADPADARLLDEFLAAVTGSGRYRQGLATLDVLGRLAPGSADIPLRTWHLALRADDPLRARDALLSLDRALEGKDPQVQVWLAEACSALHETDAALAALDAAAAANPPPADLPYHRARVLRAAGRQGEALRVLRIPASGPNRVDAQALQVRLLVETGQAQAARRAADEALRARPDDYTLLGALVSAAAALDERETMLAAVDRMAGLSGEARARTRARSLAGVGDVESALLALRATPLSEPETWLLGGTLLRDARRAPEAVTWMSRAVDRFPSDASLRAGLGGALADAGQASDALVAMREALALDPGEADAVRYYAAVASARGATPDRLTKAEWYLLSALERRPADVTLLVPLGDVLMSLGEPARAAEIWGEAFRYAGRDRALATRLAGALREAGRVEEASAVEARFPGDLP